MFRPLTKECPHCHEESFSFRELISLDYFNFKECKVCGKLARNDGFRQLLTIPGALLAMFIGVVIFSLLPDLLMPLGLLLIAVLMAGMITLLAKPVRFESSETDAPPFIPDPNNDKIIYVSGWTEEELRPMVDDFIEEGSLSPRIDLHKQHDTLYHLTFPEDIWACDFASLINYLNYSVKTESAGRSIAVGGRATLNSEFEGIPKSLMGTKAIFYGPENNEEHDVVYLKTDAAVFATSFLQGSSWEPVSESRLPANVKILCA